MAMRILLLIAAAGALAACDSDNNGAKVDLPRAPEPQRLEDSFGAGFGQSFRADTNSDPRDPMAADLGPVDLTKDPTRLR
jgi:hypothetical protein